MEKEEESKSKVRQDVLLQDLLAGSEQLLFSFIVPSTFCSTDNINELQKLVTQGCNELHRKLLFADSLAKLPYKIGVIRGILSNLVNVLKQLHKASRRRRVGSIETRPAREHFLELQEATEGLCRYIRRKYYGQISIYKFFCSEVTVVCLRWLWTCKRAVICSRSVQIFQSLSHISCQHLLSQDAKVVTVFNMIAVPCFVYQVLHM